MIKIPEIFKEADFEKDVSKELKEKLLNNLANRKGVILFGPSGRGKTHTLYALAKHLENGHFKDLMRFYNVDTLMRKLRNFKDESEGDELLRDLTNTKSNIKILFLDDLGTQKNSEFSIECLLAILNHRYEEALPTIISTNYTIAEMKEQLGQRIFSRLSGLCEFVEKGGEDRRIEK